MNYSTYLITIAIIFALVLFGIGIEKVYKKFAKKHPELGPFRKFDGCGCCSGKCSSQGKSHCG